MTIASLSLLLGAALLGQPVGGPDAPETAVVELYVLDDGSPVSGVEARVGERSVGATDPEGALTTRIPAGRVDFSLSRAGARVLELDLLTDQGEIVLMIVSLVEDGEPEVIIESSGRELPLASERDAERRTRTSTAGRGKPGALVGTIRSAESGDPVVDAKVFFSGTRVKAETDEEGRYAVELPPGTYSISVIHPRYATQTIDDVRVIPERKVTADLELSPAGVRLEEYVVTAPYVEGSIASTIGQQREASSVSDVLGAAQISAAGDSNAAEALRRVTGLVVEEGKFVLIRGQPSRFTYALFNGSPLPSPEPLIQVVPLDLFPTGVLKDIQVQKSFTPDMPGAFGAGLVKINTRGLPEEPFARVSIGTSFNLQSVFEEGLSYEGGALDFLGLDDGTRALPESVDELTEGGTRLLNLANQDDIAEATADFPNILEAQRRTLPPDMKFGLSGGWSTEIFGDGRLGFVANAGYRNKWRFQDRAQRTFALTTNDMDEDTLVLRNDTREDRTDQNITLNGLFTLAAEWEKHQIRANTFAVNQTQRRTQLTTGEIQGTDDLFIQDYLLSWIERFLLAQQLTGEHDFGWLVVDYEALYAQAQRSAPDRRTYRFARRPGADVFSVPDQEGLDRSYSFVDETVLTAGLDLSFLLFGDEEDPFRPTVKVGAFASQIDRTAGEQRFRFTPASGADRRDPVAEEIFDPDRVGEDLLDIRDNSILGADDYEGSSEILAAYAMADIGILDIFRIVGGVRWESAVYELRAFQLAQGGGGGTVQVESGFDQTELLPAAAVTWFILEELQLRAAYGRTVSRPVFNELSPSSFFDPDTGQEYVGNEDLVPTTIDGYDARIEWYPSSTENFNLGVFFKEYTDPLERTFQPVAGGDPIATFQNADSAQVLGLEVGGRVEGGRLGDLFGGSSFLDNIYVLANAAIMDSTVDLAEQGVATDETRALDGQADLVLNAQAGYDGENVDFTAAFIYIGTRLRRVGIQGQPNILQDPIPVLDLNFSWRFAKDWVLSASASNLLNPTIRLTQQVEGEAAREFRAFTRGIQLGAGLKWTFL